MSASIVKAVILVAFCVAPFAVAAQTAGESKSERAMPAKTGEPPAKSERALPTQSKPADTPPAADERAMPSPEKK